MTPRLFLKILLGFWAAMVCMLACAWLVYLMLWGDRPSFEQEVATIVAPYQVALAKQALAQRGLAGLQGMVRQWPRSQASFPADDSPWSRIIVTPDGDPPYDSANPDIARASVADPQQQRWRIQYKLPVETPRNNWSAKSFLRYYLSAEWAIPTLLCGLLFSACLAWYLSRPIYQLRDGFRRLAAGELDTRLASAMSGRRDEVADLAKDFDRMAARLQQLLLARDRLLHDVSHELRSPLARLNLAATLLQQQCPGAGKASQRITKEVACVDALVDELLTLSRCEHGEREPDVYFELKGLLHAVISDARFEASSRDILIDVRMYLAPSVLVQGDAQLIRRALENIVRNAIQFSSATQHVVISCFTNEISQMARVVVEDNGPGVPLPELQHVLEPFVRLNGRRRAGGGSGLGLAIADRAARGHGGSLALSNRQGGGLAVTLEIPFAQLPHGLAE